MSETSYIKAGLMALALLIGFMISWEIYLRLAGYEISYNDDEALWAYHRQRIYQATDANPVLIGSSRFKFGIDLSSWEAVTGALPMQLSIVGTSPRPLLADLANDPKFRGTALVGVTEGLFFTPSGSFPEQQAQKCVAFYPKWSIAQKGGFAINHVLEPHLLFLDEERFSLRGLLAQLPVDNRSGVFALPPFPQKFVNIDFNRQTSMTDEFVADTSLQNQVKSIWMYVANNAPSGPMPDSVLTTVFQEVKDNVAQIQQRGGKVIFVRMPSTGVIREGERKAFPREQYWDRLIRESGAAGVHFEDYPELSKYDCPEWSHLSPQDAKTFTKDLIKIIRQQTS
jgi:hypothetical protein